MKIGLVAIENPELTVEEIRDILEARVDYQADRVSKLNLLFSFGPRQGIYKS